MASPIRSTGSNPTEGAPPYSVFDDATRLAKPRNRQSNHTPIPVSNELLPLKVHRDSRGPFGIYVCETRAGRPRAFHDYDREGHCIHCGHYDETADVPLGQHELTSH